MIYKITNLGMSRLAEEGGLVEYAEKRPSFLGFRLVALIRKATHWQIKANVANLVLLANQGASARQRIA